MSQRHEKDGKSTAVPPGLVRHARRSAPVETSTKLESEVEVEAGQTGRGARAARLRVWSALRLNRQTGGFPRRDAARNFGHIVDAGALQQARCDGRSITAGAVDEDRTIRRNLADTLDEVSQRDVDAAGDSLLGDLVRRPDVDEKRGSIVTKSVGGYRSARVAACCGSGRRARRG